MYISDMHFLLWNNVYCEKRYTNKFELNNTAKALLVTLSVVLKLGSNTVTGNTL